MDDRSGYRTVNKGYQFFFIQVAVATGIFTIATFSATALAEERVTLAVTHGFNEKVIDGAVLIEPETSVIDVLKSRAQVVSSFGDAFVTRISGYPAEDYRGDGYWFFYVNGLLADTAANTFTVTSGDSIWWDFHTYSESMNLAAVIGSYPEPFRSRGVKRNLPTRIFCAEELCVDASKLAESLRQKGVQDVSQYRLSTKSLVGDEALNILVGKWSDLIVHARTKDISEHALTLGLFIKLNSSGQLFGVDIAGKTLATWSNAGFIAATGTAVGGPPVWLISGNDNDWTRQAIQTLVEKPESIANKSQVAITELGMVTLPIVEVSSSTK